MKITKLILLLFFQSAIFFSQAQQPLCRDGTGGEAIFMDEVMRKKLIMTNLDRFLDISPVDFARVLFVNPNDPENEPTEFISEISALLEEPIDCSMELYQPISTFAFYYLETIVEDTEAGEQTFNHLAERFEIHLARAENDLVPFYITDMERLLDPNFFDWVISNPSLESLLADFFADPNEELAKLLIDFLRILNEEIVINQYIVTYIQDLELPIGFATSNLPEFEEQESRTDLVTKLPAGFISTPNNDPFDPNIHSLDRDNISHLFRAGDNLEILPNDFLQFPTWWTSRSGVGLEPQALPSFLNTTPSNCSSSPCIDQAPKNSKGSGITIFFIDDGIDGEIIGDDIETEYCISSSRQILISTNNATPDGVVFEICGEDQIVLEEEIILFDPVSEESKPFNMLGFSGPAHNCDESCSHGSVMAQIAIGEDRSKSSYNLAGNPVAELFGAAPEAAIHSIQVGSKFHGDSKYLPNQIGMFRSDVLRALKYIQELDRPNDSTRDANIINMSLDNKLHPFEKWASRSGHDADCDSEQTGETLGKILKSLAEDFHIVIAAGNSELGHGNNAQGLSWPACASHGLTVGAYRFTGSNRLDGMVNFEAPGGRVTMNTHISACVHPRFGTQVTTTCTTSTSNATAATSGAIAACLSNDNYELRLDRIPPLNISNPALSEIVTFSDICQWIE